MHGCTVAQLSCEVVFTRENTRSATVHQLCKQPCTVVHSCTVVHGCFHSSNLPAGPSDGKILRGRRKLSKNINFFTFLGFTAKKSGGNMTVSEFNYTIERRRFERGKDEKMKLGQFVVASIGDKDCTLTNQLYQIWKSNQQSFEVAGVKYTSIKKHSTSAVAKAVKTRWYTFTDGSSMEVLDSEDYKPRKEIESLCWRSVKTWFEVE